MVKVRGALMSLTAQGTIAGTITFSNRQTGQQARFQKKQTTPPTAGQTLIRDNYRLGISLWNSMSQTEKAYWKEIEKKGFVDV